MASSEVAICNLALTYIGDSSITALTDNTDRARACNAHYNDCRDQVLRMHPWNSSIVRTGLAALTDSPAWEWAYQFTLPTDPYCLRIIEVENLDDREWAVEGRVIMSDQSTLNIKYISRITDVSEMDPLLIDVIAQKLAHTIAYRITGSVQKQSELLQTFRMTLREARMMDGQEGAPPDIYSDHFAAVRFGTDFTSDWRKWTSG